MTTEDEQLIREVREAVSRMRSPYSGRQYMIVEDAIAKLQCDYRESMKELIRHDLRLIARMGMKEKS